jgi:hypothetical protein
MTSESHAGWHDVHALAEQYMARMPTCLLCHEMPASTPLVYLADGAARGCIFATCMVCWCQEDFERRVRAALRQEQGQRTSAAWN